MNGHTPGPWHVHRTQKWSHVKAANGDYVMEANYRGIARQHADARLIAASPTMATYLRELAGAGDVRAAEILEGIHAAR